MHLCNLLVASFLVDLCSTACTTTDDSKSADSGDDVAAVRSSDKLDRSSGNTRKDYETALAEARAAHKTFTHAHNFALRRYRPGSATTNVERPQFNR